MKKFITLFFIVTFWMGVAFAAAPDQVATLARGINRGRSPIPNPPRVNNSMWLEQPKVGMPVPKENAFKLILWRADKWRTSEDWRYEPHVTSRNYVDCSYYKYVNCHDMRFCRCWQCRDFQYPYEYAYHVR